MNFRKPSETARKIADEVADLFELSRYRHGVICETIDAALADERAAAEKVMAFAQHKPDCWMLVNPYNECTCGLDAARAEYAKIRGNG